MPTVQVGKPAPPFTAIAVVDGRMKEVSLSTYAESNHWIILVFFPQAWSFICPTEIRAFSARLEEFLYSRSCAVVFCSTDSEYCLKAWNNASELEGGLGGVHVPLVSDRNRKISRDYGVLIEDEGVTQRALFIIDPKGVIRSITVNDVDVGRSVDETLRVLDALVFKDEFGEGCPVDWKKGQSGIPTSIPLEGRLELKKSWSEWARPRLQRAWSATSQRSVSSLKSPTSMTTTTTPTASVALSPPNTSGGSPSRTPSLYAPSIGQHSPYLSPTSAGRGYMEAQMDEAVLAQQMENMQAALANGEKRDIGVAN